MVQMQNCGQNLLHASKFIIERLRKKYCFVCFWYCNLETNSCNFVKSKFLINFKCSKTSFQLAKERQKTQNIHVKYYEQHSPTSTTVGKCIRKQRAFTSEHNLTPYETIIFKPKNENHCCMHCLPLDACVKIICIARVGILMANAKNYYLNMCYAVS